MTLVKAQLREVRKLKKDIEAKKRERDTLYASVLGSGIPIKTVDVQTSTSGDVFGDRMAEIADYDKLLEEEIINLIRMQQAVNRIINTLKKPEHRAILTDYYINGYTWDRVADLNGYSTQHIYELHGEALKKLENIKIKY